MALAAPPDAAPIPVHASRLWCLRNVGLFRDLDADDLESIGREARSVRVSRGEQVCASGLGNAYVYVVREGHVRMVVTAASGKRLATAILKRGDLIGELEIGGTENDGGLRPAVEAAEAVDDAELLAVPVDRLRELVLRRPHLALSVTQLAGRRRTEVLNRLQDVLFLTVAQRLARLVRRLAEEHPGETVQGHRFVNLRLTHAELADLVGSNREAVSATLARFRTARLVSTAQGRLVIRDEAGLAAAAAD